MNTSKLFVFLAIVLVAAALVAQQPGQSSPEKAWVARSNENTRVLLEVGAKFSPEAAGQAGFDGVDDQVFDLKPQVDRKSVV